MEKKKTAVEWLVEQLIPNAMRMFDATTCNAIDQAKQMEREQMKKAALDNVTTNEKLRKIFEIQFEDFYKETYGGNNE
jgi:hypothetical protein